MPTADEQDSVAGRRGRRDIGKKKAGREAALERLRLAKSDKKDKYAISLKEDEAVYEEVSEAQYSKLVQERQQESWIDDDAEGNGYFEDGREIFDDDIHVEEAAACGASGKKGKKREEEEKKIPKSKNIRNMFINQATKTSKKVEKNVSLDDDEYLKDLMDELHKTPSSSFKPKPVSLSASRKNGSNLKANAAFKPSPVVTTSSLKSSISAGVKTPSSTRTMKMRKKVRLDDSHESEEVSCDQVDEDHTSYSLPRKISSNSTPTSSTHEGLKDTVEHMKVDDIDFDEQMQVESVPVTVQTSQEKQTSCKPVPELSSTSWSMSMNDGDVDDGAMVNVDLDLSSLPLTDNEDGEKVLRMYWLDAYEDPFKQPGVVYMFGKVAVPSAHTHASCCLIVKNIERQIFVLPREKKLHPQTGKETDETVSFVDVYEEFNSRVAERYKIGKFKSKTSTLGYVFDKLDVPVMSEYLEVRYDASLPQIRSDTKGNTFSHIFGTNTTSLELFLLDRKIRGPCWLDVRFPQVNDVNVSWCKTECCTLKPQYVSVSAHQPPPPPLTLLTLTLQTVVNTRTKQSEVLAAAMLVHHNYSIDKRPPQPPYQHHLIAITKPHDCIFPFDLKEKLSKHKRMQSEVIGTERGLLAFLLAKINKIDPDVIVGHDVLNYDLSVLLHRIQENKIPHWSRIGRLRRANIPKSGAHGKLLEKAAVCGRLLSDIQISSKELIRCKSYDLTELCKDVLSVSREEIDVANIRNMYSCSKTLISLLEHTLSDCLHTLNILGDLNVLPLALQITQIAGNVMSRTLLGGRSERNEYLLLHAFHDKNYICPDKEYNRKETVQHVTEDGEEVTVKKSKSGKKKAAYAGGLVLDPKKGFYDTFILLLDFNSLYPSIIQEYNICFTTIDRQKMKQQGGVGEEDVICDLPESGLSQGILPAEIRKLVESRREVKNLMKGHVTPEQYTQYDIRQKALKLTANSMYGCLGFSFSRFYAKHMAALITAKGREILLQTRDLVCKLGLDVIYGDTDSIMINTNSTDLDEVYKLGNMVKKEVNKTYRLLELDIDGVFASMLLLKKKKYAALSVSRAKDGKLSYIQELKGLDVVRRDWCDLAKTTGQYVIEQLLSIENRENIIENIHSKLTEVGDQVRKGEVELDQYEIRKQLTKSPEDYPDKKSLPHVQVALRVNTKGGRKYKQGDTVSYIVCEDGSTLAATMRAYHPDELKNNDSIKIDTKYYLSNQLHPVISRLCEPISETDPARLAECLGLDPGPYHHRTNNAAREDAEEDALLGTALTPTHRYEGCEPITLPCPSCSTTITISSPLSGTGPDLQFSLVSGCESCHLDVTNEKYQQKLMNKLQLIMSSHIRTYYKGRLRCEDKTCAAESRRLPLRFYQAQPRCSQCDGGSPLIPVYSEHDLYTQLSYLHHILDLSKAVDDLAEDDKDKGRILLRTADPHITTCYTRLREVVQRKLDVNAYSNVDLTSLFHPLLI